MRFVDTSAWYAYLDRKAPEHRRVASEVERRGLRLMTSNFVFDELVTLVRVRQGFSPAAQAGDALRDPALVRMERVTSEDEEAAWRRFLARPDKTYSFTDCTSFVVAERLGIAEVIATDPDFGREGFTVLPGRR